MENIEQLIAELSSASSTDAINKLATLATNNEAALLIALGSSRVLEILDEASDAERNSILGSLPPGVQNQWSINAQYPKRSVGRFVESTQAVFYDSATVKDVITALRGLINQEFITYSFIVNAQRQLIGVLTMRELLFSNAEAFVEEIMVRNPFALTPDMPLEDAVKSVVTKHFPVYPVINSHKELVGVVRGGRLFEAQAIEITAQAGTMVGVEKEERLTTTCARSFKLRHPWLQINLLTAFLAGAVVSLFQSTIDQLVILASFLPVLAGQSGNTGCQALAVTIRGVTLGDYKAGRWVSLVRKEALLGALNGFFVGLIAGGGMYFMASLQHNPNALVLSTVVLCAMIGSCVISGVSGVLVPLTLKRFGFDPATASSIFLTTATDVASMGMLLGLATLFVL